MDGGERSSFFEKTELKRVPVLKVCTPAEQAPNSRLQTNETEQQGREAVEPITYHIRNICNYRGQP